PGVRGGQVVASGSFAEILANRDSLTGQYLAGARQIAVPAERRPRSKKRLQILGARHNNLKNIDVDIPLGVFVCVTGVSGSGKSSLINDILMQGVHSTPYGAPSEENGEVEENGDDSVLGTQYSVLGTRCDRIDGLEH